VLHKKLGTIIWVQREGMILLSPMGQTAPFSLITPKVTTVSTVQPAGLTAGVAATGAVTKDSASVGAFEGGFLAMLLNALSGVEEIFGSMAAATSARPTSATETVVDAAANLALLDVTTGMTADAATFVAARVPGWLSATPG